MMVVKLISILNTSWENHQLAYHILTEQKGTHSALNI